MKALALLSGGIDSPVSAYLMDREGWDVVLVHFDNRPLTDDSYVERVSDLARRLANLAGRPYTLFVVPHGVNQAEVGRNCERRYQCVICRRIMLRTASALARRIGAEVLVTGENIGQVASQTIDNLLVENGASSVPVVRPLIAMDKEDIIGIAEEIGTFEASTRPGICCMMAPDRPATEARFEAIQAEEARLDLERMTENALAEMEEHVFDPGDL